MVARLITAATLALAGGQQFRYQRLRRQAQDRQPPLYPSGTHHALYLLEAAPGSSPMDAVRSFHQGTGDLSEVRWIYAGRVVTEGVRSPRLEPGRWDAAVIMSFSSREYHELLSQSLMFRRALEETARVEAYGFVRRPWANLSIPQVLAGRWILRRVRRDEAIMPLIEADEPAAPVTALARRLREASAPADRPGVVISLVKRGSEADQTSDRRYTGRMLDLMAEGGFGPLHVGSVTDEAFDQLTAIAYPSVDAFADILLSRFYREVSTLRRPADTETVITVPILDRL